MVAKPERSGTPATYARPSRSLDALARHPARSAGAIPPWAGVHGAGVHALSGGTSVRREHRRDQILAVVRRIVSDHLGVDESTIHPEASMFDDLGADSLDSIELSLALEEAFEVEVDPEVADSIDTIADIVAHIERLV